MAGKIVIDIFKEKKAEDFTTALAAPESKAGAGSAAAYTAAMGDALVLRVAKNCAAANEGDERLDYIVRNSEILRGYMVHLIDEAVKSKGPINRAKKEGGPREIEASIQTATCIEAEIVNMTKPALEFALELCDRAAEEDKSLLAEAAELVMSACRVSQHVIAAFSSLSSDETYRYVTRRENEVFLAEREELYNKIIEKAKQ